MALTEEERQRIKAHPMPAAKLTAIEERVNNADFAIYFYSNEVWELLHIDKRKLNALADIKALIEEVKRYQAIEKYRNEWKYVNSR